MKLRSLDFSRVRSKMEFLFHELISCSLKEKKINLINIAIEVNMDDLNRVTIKIKLL